jgi:hypothetical protein
MGAMIPKADANAKDVNAIVKFIETETGSTQLPAFQLLRWF